MAGKEGVGETASWKSGVGGQLPALLRCPTCQLLKKHLWEQCLFLPALAGVQFLGLTHLKDPTSPPIALRYAFQATWGRAELFVSSPFEASSSPLLEMPSPLRPCALDTSRPLLATLLQAADSEP